ncbi:unnamed protein product [Pararhodospirillum photometricum DSM 122]|uniref:Uncharacterized protein n=1 Tax=Pararhodospirillum photometricum DSM 122 TaxID=1150469 RepID=H6SRJ9_PARPM|nr:unnamed protein product [Pararhodospirillum photometricum DSM 122]
MHGNGGAVAVKDALDAGEMAGVEPPADHHAQRRQAEFDAIGSEGQGPAHLPVKPLKGTLLNGKTDTRTHNTSPAGIEGSGEAAPPQPYSS